MHLNIHKLARLCYSKSIMGGVSLLSAIKPLVALPLTRGFLISLLALAILCVLTNVLRARGSARIDAMMRRLAAFLLERGLFRVPLQAAQRKLNILRIAAGLVFLHRTICSALFILPDAAPLPTTVFCLVALAAGFALTAGLATPVAALLLLFFNLFVIDGTLHTYTLGSDVLSMLLLVFAAVPAGTVFSLDAWILRRGLPGAGLLRAIYRFTGVPSVLRIVIATWMSLLSYSLLCLFSVLMHLHEPLWLTGDAAIYLMTSSFMSRAHALFLPLFTHSLFWSDLARLAMIGMVAWYFYLLPFTLAGGWLRRFAILWSILFFLFSLCILELQWLTFYEFILLTLWFWSRKFLHRARGLEILYDDRCNLCDRTIRTLRRLDIFRVLVFRPLSRNAELVAQLGLAPDAVLHDLYGYDRGRRRLYCGYRFYTELAGRIFLLAWLWPFAWVGAWTRIGPALYRVIADRRIRWFGVCMRSQDYNYVDRSVPGLGVRARPVAKAWFAAFFAVHAALAICFIATLPCSPLPRPRLLTQVAHVYSIADIDVFNVNDLNMSAHWFTVEGFTPDGASVLAPITAVDGSRLGWHMSDAVYFGNTLAWRRARRPFGPLCYSADDAPYVAQQLGWFARRQPGLTGDYRLSYYYQPLPALARDYPYLRLQAAQKVCTVTVRLVNGRVEEQNR